MSLIIIEGADCAGKTTLAGNVVDVLRATYPDDHVTYLHAGVPQEPPLDEYVEPLLDYRPGTGRHVVCDRWHVGESVYPAVLGRPTQLTPSVRWYVEAFLRSRGALLVYCKATAGHLVECGVARDDPADEVDRVPATVREFDRAVASSSLPVNVFDVTRPVPDYQRQVALEVVARSTFHASRAEVVNPFVTYVGPSRPALLLVGDRRGIDGEPSDWGLWPAFAPRPATSGDYLLTTLTSTELRVADHGLTVGDVGLVNANDVDDVRACWDAVGRPPVVVLGRQAERTLRALDVPHRAAAHPQYARRFHYHRRERYLAQLLGVDAREVVA